MNRKDIVREIYRLYEQWVRDHEFACRKGCSTCCTRSVTMTELEGRLIGDYIESHPELAGRLPVDPETLHTPSTTTNRFAELCMAGRDEQDDDDSWSFEPCSFLHDDSCLIYPVRSFMCRSFGSRVRCDESGVAEVEPWFLSLNTVIMQCLEHLDQGRPWGNMFNILRHLHNPGVNQNCASLLTSVPSPGLLLHPDEMERLGSCIQTLTNFVSKDG